LIGPDSKDKNQGSPPTKRCIVGVSRGPPRTGTARRGEKWRGVIVGGIGPRARRNCPVPRGLRRATGCRRSWSKAAAFSRPEHQGSGRIRTGGGPARGAKGRAFGLYPATRGAKPPSTGGALGPCEERPGRAIGWGRNTRAGRVVTEGPRGGTRLVPVDRAAANGQKGPPRRAPRFTTGHLPTPNHQGISIPSPAAGQGASRAPTGERILLSRLDHSEAVGAKGCSGTALAEAGPAPALTSGLSAGGGGSCGVRAGPKAGVCRALVFKSGPRAPPRLGGREIQTGKGNVEALRVSPKGGQCGAARGKWTRPPCNGVGSFKIGLAITWRVPP